MSWQAEEIAMAMDRNRDWSVSHHTPRRRSFPLDRRHFHVRQQSPTFAGRQ